MTFTRVTVVVNFASLNVKTFGCDKGQLTQHLYLKAIKCNAKTRLNLNCMETKSTLVFVATESNC